MSINRNEPLSIPPAILALNDVTASEKMLLALYVAEPRAINFRALQVLGVGSSGLKKIKHRLLTKGLLKLTATGYQTLVPGFMPAPEETEGHFVSNSECAEKCDKVAPAPARLAKERSPVEIWDRYVAMYAQALRFGSFPDALEMLSQNFLDFATKEVPLDWPGRDKTLTALTARRDYWFAASYISDNLPRDSQRKLGKVIGRATPEQLAALRTGIEQAKLKGIKPALLLEQFSSEMKAPPAHDARVELRNSDILTLPPI